MKVWERRDVEVVDAKRSIEVEEKIFEDRC